MRRLFVLAFPLLGLACGLTLDLAAEVPGADGGPLDAGPLDSGPRDSGAAGDGGGDSGPRVDSGADGGGDSGPLDGGPLDAGPPPIFENVYGVQDPVDIAPRANSLVGVVSIDTDSKVVLLDGGNRADGAMIDVPLAGGAGTGVALRVKSWTQSIPMKVTGSKPLVVVADTLVFSATVDVSGHSVANGPGAPGANGAGKGGTGKGGGGGGAYGGDGAAGGAATYTLGAEPGGVATAAYGNSFALLAGSVGGASGGAGGSCGRGGGAGGALLLHAATSLQLSGTILAHGGGGEGGCASPAAVGGSGGGGGGSGGTVLLDSPSLAVTGKIYAFGGGGGGGGASSLAGVRGKNGEDPPATGQGAAGGGSTNGVIVGAVGFNGAAGGSGGGTAGAQAGQSDGSGGGGGGGVGRLYLRGGGAAALTNQCAPQCTVLP